MHFQIPAYNFPLPVCSRAIGYESMLLILHLKNAKLSYRPYAAVSDSYPVVSKL